MVIMMMIDDYYDYYVDDDGFQSQIFLRHFHAIIYVYKSTKMLIEFDPSFFSVMGCEAKRVHFHIQGKY